MKETLEQVEGQASNATFVPPGNAAMHGKQAIEGHRQSHFPLPINGLRSPTRSQAAKEVAYRRWSLDLSKFCDGDWKRHGAMIDAITDDMADAATDAEMRRKGCGLANILAALQDDVVA